MWRFGGALLEQPLPASLSTCSSRSRSLTELGATLVLAAAEEDSGVAEADWPGDPPAPTLWQVSLTTLLKFLCRLRYDNSIAESFCFVNYYAAWEDWVLNLGLRLSVESDCENVLFAGQTIGRAPWVPQNSGGYRSVLLIFLITLSDVTELSSIWLIQFNS